MKLPPGRGRAAASQVPSASPSRSKHTPKALHQVVPARPQPLRVHARRMTIDQMHDVVYASATELAALALEVGGGLPDANGQSRPTRIVGKYRSKQV